jgi:hypothetical protein
MYAADIVWRTSISSIATERKSRRETRMRVRVFNYDNVMPRVAEVI